MGARRCRVCLTPWPARPGFATCPECLAPCDYIKSDPIGSEETERRLNQVDFENYYELHDISREGPTPEEEGAEEAREMLEDFWAEVGEMMD